MVLVASILTKKHPIRDELLNFERLFMKKLYNENTRPTITSLLIMIMRKNIYIIIVTNFQMRLSQYFVFCH